ncbi:MAG: molecular chaperone DnaJ [Phenylobacterium sp.]
MQLIALGALALLVLVWVGRSGGAILKRREWRIGAGATAVAALAGAALLGFREAWLPAAGLLILSLWMAVAARRNGVAPARPSSRMSLKEARSILGVEADATPAEIRAAHKRLMRHAHPDAGGTSGLAAQLNAARDRLLGDVDE